MAPTRRRSTTSSPGATTGQTGQGAKDAIFHVGQETGTSLDTILSSLKKLDRRLSRLETGVVSTHVVKSVDDRSDKGNALPEHLQLKQRLSRMEAENAYLQAQLEDRFREIATLTLMLHEHETSHDNSRGKSGGGSTQPLLGFGDKTPGKSGSWNLARLLKRPEAGAGKLKKAIATIEASGLFEARWYADTYITDDAERRDPIRHYLLVGAKQGNDPSASFCTKWYLDKYPDVAASGINPLLHYIKHGKEEGRDPLPF